MTLHPPFLISSRLLPAVTVGGATISAESNGHFIIDLPDGTEHTVTDLHPPQGRVAGRNDTPERLLAQMFASLLCFLGACAESRARRGRDVMDGENSDLFPDNVGAWAESCSDELACLQLEIEESETDLIES